MSKLKSHLYSLFRGLLLYSVEVQLEILNFLASKVCGDQAVLPLDVHLTAKLEVILLLRDKGVVNQAKVESLIRCHLQHRGFEDLEVRAVSLSSLCWLEGSEVKQLDCL